eukprot:gene11387-8104_t
MGDATTEAFAKEEPEMIYANGEMDTYIHQSTQPRQVVQETLFLCTTEAFAKEEPEMIYANGEMDAGSDQKGSAPPRRQNAEVATI